MNKTIAYNKNFGCENYSICVSSRQKHEYFSLAQCSTRKLQKQKETIKAFAELFWYK